MTEAAMAHRTPWLVTYITDDGGHFCGEFATLDDAIPFMHQHRNETPRLWEPSRFPVTLPADAAPLAPKKKRTPRKRKESTSAAAADVAPPASTENAAAPVAVRPAAPPPAAPPAPAAVSRPSCGGKACEDRDGKEIHRLDPSCSKFQVTKRTVAR